MSRRYWVKIAIGAVIIFILGMVVVRAGREGTTWAEELAHSASPISIPMAFVPFRVDGEDLGTMRRLVLLRDAPNHVSGARLTVRMSENANAPACPLTVTETSRLEHTTFRCAEAADIQSNIAFARVVFEPGGERDLYLPAEMIRSWQQDAPADEAPAPDTPAMPSDDGEARVQLSAGAHGLTLSIVDALEQAGLQLQADSTGAIFHARDDKSDTHVAMRADSAGFSLQVIERGKATVVMQADSGGVQMNVRERRP